MSKDVEKSSTGNRYGLTERQRGFLALAYNNGVYSRAARELNAAGVSVTERTLSAWHKGEPEEYERIRRQVLGLIGAEIASEHAALAHRNNEVEIEAVEKLKEKLPELDAKDLPNAVRSIATASGIHTDKARLLQGDYATPSESTRSAEEIMRKLKSRGMVIEAEATEEQDALPFDG